MLHQSNLLTMAIVLLLNLTFGQRTDGMFGNSMLRPGYPAPAYELPTLQGKFTGVPSTPVLFHASNPSSLISETMVLGSEWEGFLNLSPNNTHYVFVTYAQDAYQYAMTLHNRAEHALTEMNMTTQQKDSWMARLHFVTKPVPKLTGAPWIAQLLAYWPSSSSVVTVRYSGKHQHNGHVEMDDAGSNHTIPCVNGTGGLTQFKQFPTKNFTDLVIMNCSAEPTQNFSKKLVLVSRAECGSMPFNKTLALAHKQGAMGVVMFTSENQPATYMHCPNGINACNGVPMPATMIPYSEGKKLERLLMQGMKLELLHHFEPSNALGFIVGADGNLTEIGWFMFPSLKFFGWEAQWQNYYFNLEHQLNRLEAPHSENLVITIFNGSQVMGPHGAYVIDSNITLPPYHKLQAALARGGKILLDHHLDCPGWNSSTCPIWDRTIESHMKCGQWSYPGFMGRWISPFRVREGRWLTNITPLLPYFNATNCTYGMQTDPWIEKPWLPKLKLIVTKFYSSDPPTGEDIPIAAKKMFYGAWSFNKKYETHFPLVHWETKPEYTKTKIWSIITGHGFDNHGCGEFCATTHVWTVNNNKPFIENFSLPTTNPRFGCTKMVRDGALPGEHGTWLFGRDGWCDGNKVPAVVFDVTKDTKPPGGMNTLKYRGYWNNSVPDPTGGDADMDVRAELIFYGKPQRTLH